MDSPLLPRLQNGGHPDETANLLADMFLASPEPSSTSRPKSRFSLFAQPPNGHMEDQPPPGDEDVTVHASVMKRPNGVSSHERDERLRESLYELRRMNEVFDGVLNALEAARGHNQVKTPLDLLMEAIGHTGEADFDFIG